VDCPSFYRELTPEVDSHPLNHRRTPLNFLSTTNNRPWTPAPEVRKQSVAFGNHSPTGTAPGQDGVNSSYSACSVLYSSEFETGFLNEVWTEAPLR